MTCSETDARMSAFLAAVDAAADAEDVGDTEAQVVSLSVAVAHAVVLLDDAANGCRMPARGPLAGLAAVVLEGEQEEGLSW